ncbi:class I SAM-dependent methyltransferase [Flavobacterium sp.]|jgi:SAM-dependent methyltransferase|uniref:class I SAM-dependent methyltransferase n=1 Tax=Flavobacterium sp. TaxID=239 RepID=UPI002A7ECF33|nr:class I SAM-dependent methyltransferase [Flavobacterium sp.]
MENIKKEHWEKVFTTKAENEVSWFQKQPETSIQLIKACKLPKDAKIIDIGGGDSYLIDSLIELGYTNLYLLDISENAIERSKKRLGANADKVTFIVSDVLDFITTEKFDAWHDRASFHFLTNETDIIKYRTIVSNALNSNGSFLLGTFSDEGPLKCSGLEITQYSVEKILDLFEEEFEMENCFTEDHETPFDTTQNFIFCHFRKQ